MEHDPLSLGAAQASRRSPRSRQSSPVLLSRQVLWSSPFLLPLLILLGVGSLATPSACAQSIIPARPEAIGGGNPIEGLGRPDDPNPSREADFSSRFDPYASESDSSEGSEAKTEDSLGRNEKPQAQSDSTETKNDFSEARNESNEARTESAESKHEFAEGQSESKDAFNEGAESRSDSAADLDSSESTNGRTTRRRTGSLAPTMSSPQPGQTVKRGGFTNFTKQQEALINLDLKLRAAEKARQKAAEKQAAKAGATKGEKSNEAKGGDTAKSDTSKSTKTVNSDKGTNANKAYTTQADATRKLSQADQSGKNSAAKVRSSKQGLVPPPPPYSVPLVSKSEDTPERKALDLINKKKYATAESKLQEIILENPENYHARYLLGIALVWQRKYDEAKKEYAYVVEHSPDEKLIDLARQGLQKL